jgi:hypothetical protein
MSEKDETFLPDASRAKDPDVAHEASDVSVSAIAKFGVALFLLVAVICYLMLAMFRYFDERERLQEIKTEPPPSKLVRSAEELLPPEPRLQGVPGHEADPREDLRRMRQREEELLGSYGWIDRQSGIVRIPIERAKKLLLEREKTHPAERRSEP